MSCLTHRAGVLVTLPFQNRRVSKRWELPWSSRRRLDKQTLLRMLLRTTEYAAPPATGHDHVPARLGSAFSVHSATFLSCPSPLETDPLSAICKRVTATRDTQACFFFCSIVIYSRTWDLPKSSAESRKSSTMRLSTTRSAGKSRIAHPGSSPRAWSDRSRR